MTGRRRRRAQHLCYNSQQHSGIVLRNDFPMHQKQCHFGAILDLKDVRNKHFVASYIKDLFDTIEAHKIIDFIKETRFYKQL